MYCRETIKNLGKFTCYDQNQLDAIYKLIKTGNNNNPPNGALIKEMGSIVGEFLCKNILNLVIGYFDYAWTTAVLHSMIKLITFCLIYCSK